MECEKIRRKLSAFSDGELEKGAADEVSAHVRTCPACRMKLDEIEKVDTMVRAVPAVSVSESFAARAVAEALKKPAQAEVPGLLYLLRAGFSKLADLFCELLPDCEFRKTATLDEFGDFPPLLLGHAYFQLLGHK